MDKKQRSALRRFRRVHEFLTANPVETTTVKLQALDEVIRQMAGNGEEQDAHDRKLRGETARQLALRLALRNQHMVPISRIARQVFSVPGMDVKFLLPRKLKDNQLILNAARGMAQAAEQHAAVFVQEGLPADFVERFRSAIEALASVLEVRVESQRRRQTSRQALEKLRKRGVATVDVLDAIVKPRLEDKPDVLAAWNSVKRPNDIGGGAPAGLVEPTDPPVVRVA